MPMDSSRDKTEKKASRRTIWLARLGWSVLLCAPRDESVWCSIVVPRAVVESAKKGPEKAFSIHGASPSRGRAYCRQLGKADERGEKAVGRRKLRLEWALAGLHRMRNAPPLEALLPAANWTADEERRRAVRRRQPNRCFSGSRE